MKRSIHRLKSYIEDNKSALVYILAKDGRIAEGYKKYIEGELNKELNTLVLSELNMYSFIENMRKGYYIDVPIVLCGTWYKNPLVEKYDLLKYISGAYTIPVDEIERTKAEYSIANNILQYEVWTRDKYISFLCCNGSSLNNAIKVWDVVSKGYNFIIAIKSNDESIGYMIYSVSYFNDYIIDKKIKDDIRIISIAAIHSSNHTISLFVKYKYKDIKCDLTIETTKMLGKEEIKQYIRRLYE